MSYDTLNDLIHSDSEEIIYLPISQLRPDPEQDRTDWESPSAQDHLITLASSMSIELEDGSMYGIRDPLDVSPLGEDGFYEIISGESRWRAAQIAGVEKAPCIIRSYKDKKLRRYDHVTENSIKRKLNLYDRAKSILKDREENGYNNETIMRLHGISSATQMSKILKVLDLPEKAQHLVKNSYVQDANLVYDLKKLNDDEVQRVIDEVENGGSVPSILKNIKQEKNKKPEKSDGGSNDSSKTKKEKPDTAKLTLNYDQAHWLAKKLKVEIYSTETKEVVNAIAEKLGK